MKQTELDQIIREEVQTLLREGFFSKIFKKKAKEKVAGKSFKGSKFAAKKIRPDQIDYPDWLKKKINDVHGKQGQGSVFSKQVISELPDLVRKEASKQSAQILDHFAKKQTPYFLKFKKPGAGHELVATKVEGGWATPGGKMIVDPKVGKATKYEGPNPVEVPKVEITPGPGSNISMKDFETDEVTALIVPARKIVNGVPSGPPIKGKYTVITAFPGGDLPRASEWAGKHAVVVVKPRNAMQKFIDKDNVARQNQDQIDFLSGYQGMKPTSGR